MGAFATFGFGAFQPTLRLIGGGNRAPSPSTGPATAFQPTLRLIGGGNCDAGGRAWTCSCFNPPSASSAEGTRLARHHGDAVLVSTHPPPHRRRERKYKHVVIDEAAFQPTLRLIGGGNGVGSRPWGRVGCFNPPSASSAEGTRPRRAGMRGVGQFQPTLRLIGGGNLRQPPLADVRTVVSTHPPPHRRRELPSDAAPRR